MDDSIQFLRAGIFYKKEKSAGLLPRRIFSFRRNQGRPVETEIPGNGWFHMTGLQMSLQRMKKLNKIRRNGSIRFIRDIPGDSSSVLNDLVSGIRESFSRKTRIAPSPPFSDIGKHMSARLFFITSSSKDTSWIFAFPGGIVLFG